VLDEVISALAATAAQSAEMASIVFVFIFPSRFLDLPGSIGIFRNYSLIGRAIP